MIITIHIGWVIGAIIIVVMGIMIPEKNPLKWPVYMLGKGIYCTSPSIEEAELVPRWCEENIKFSKYTVYRTPYGSWHKYFFNIDDSISHHYKFLFKSDAMAFKLRWL